MTGGGWLDSVRDDRIRFVTMRPPGAGPVFLDRRVVITGPSELVELARQGRPQDLDDLVALLTIPDRAWAAVVMLAALTRREADLVNAFAARPGEWWPALGATAHQRWSTWLADARSRLRWDPAERVFVEDR